MGNKLPAYWEVRFYRRGRYSVLSKAKLSDLGRAAFWMAIDGYIAEMLPEDSMILSNGSRIVLKARVVGHQQEVEIQTADPASG